MQTWCECDCDGSPEAGSVSYITRNEYGAFCSACGSHLGIEEDDWDTCDACGGEGFDIEGDDDMDDDEPDTPQFSTPPELTAVLGEALAKAKPKS
jgi:hypothetical protein